MALTPKRKRFIDLYTDLTNSTTFGNAVESARQAGYSKRTDHTYCYALLKLPEIIAYQEQKQKELAERVNISREQYAGMVVDELARAKTEGGRRGFLELLGKCKGYLKEEGSGSPVALFSLVNNPVIDKPSIDVSVDTASTSDNTGKLT